MRFPYLRPLPMIAMAGISCGNLFSQTVAKPAAVAARIEPGLEHAVDWKWSVAPSANTPWGIPLPDPAAPRPAGAEEPGQAAEARPETYQVVKGDALGKIARKFEMTVPQLKQFNELKDDRIRIGQTLRIPSLQQLLAMAPPPPPPEPKKEATKPEPEPGYEATQALENARIQVFLDREQFSPGMIDGKAGPTFLKICEIYQQTHPDAATPALLKTKAEAAVQQPFTTYVLRPEDFKFIKPPKAEAVPTPPTARKKGAKPDNTAPPAPPLTIDQLVAEEFLAYTSAWEFVAERFHCDEAFLRRTNPQLAVMPAAGVEFKVPAVVPFEIENALNAPLQPVADPTKTVTAAIVLLSRLEIWKEGKLIAVMPLTTARPGLRGRDRWTVLDAIPQPRLATKREPREVPKATPATDPTAVAPPVVTPPPVVEPPLQNEQFLAAGPNSPVGILWINLAKARSTDPLPYGLHGTGIPGRMKLEGIGGLRLTNWDIARAVRLMPAGTSLQWRAK